MLEGACTVPQVRSGEACTLDLVELGQVRAVDGLVAEHAVDGEVLGGPEAALRARSG